MDFGGSRWNDRTSSIASHARAGSFGSCWTKLSETAPLGRGPGAGGHPPAVLTASNRSTSSRPRQSRSGSPSTEFARTAPFSLRPRRGARRPGMPRTVPSVLRRPACHCPPPTDQPRHLSSRPPPWHTSPLPGAPTYIRPSNRLSSQKRTPPASNCAQAAAPWRHRPPYPAGRDRLPPPGDHRRLVRHGQTSDRRPPVLPGLPPDGPRPSVRRRNPAAKMELDQAFCPHVFDPRGPSAARGRLCAVPRFAGNRVVDELGVARTSSRAVKDPGSGVDSRHGCVSTPSRSRGPSRTWENVKWLADQVTRLRRVR